MKRVLYPCNWPGLYATLIFGGEVVIRTLVLVRRAIIHKECCAFVIGRAFALPQLSVGLVCGC